MSDDFAATVQAAYDEGYKHGQERIKELEAQLVMEIGVRVKRVAELAEARAGLTEALDIIVWMSGSSSFSPEGEAHEGWVKARDKLDRLFALARTDGGSG